MRAKAELGRGRRYLTLRSGFYLMKGAAGAAIYDVRNRKIWQIPDVIRKALDACADGEPWQEALFPLPKSAGLPAFAVLTDFVDQHPALRFVARRPREGRAVPIDRTFRPKWLSLEITNGCNLRCRHCYIGCAPVPAGETEPTLPTSRWIALMEEGRAIGFHSLLITGGEPTLHPDLPVLLKAARRLRYRQVELLTNLARLDDDLVALLQRTGTEVQTSVYGTDAETHDAVTGGPGSFARVMQGLRRLLAAGIETTVSIVVLKKDLDLSRAIEAFLIEQGVPKTNIIATTPLPMGRATDAMEILRNNIRGRAFNAIETRRGALVVKSCLAGKTAIDPRGDVFVCLLERAALGNVGAAPLRSVVESPAMQRLWQIRLEDIPVCSQCEFRYACNDCRALAHMLSGDLHGNDPTCPYDPLTGQWRYEDLEMNERPKRKDGFVAEEMDGDVLVANFQDSQMHVLNPVAAVIWEMCDGEQTVEEIVRLLADHFKLEADAIRRDVKHILGEFRAKGLIE